jgi:isopenicillin-N N-acyltransferase-like protein
LLSDEEPWYRRARKLGAWPGRSRLPSRRTEEDPLLMRAPRKGCSSVGRNAGNGQPLLIAQNMDMAAWCAGHQLLLKVTDPTTGVRGFVFTVAGKISLAGMNDHGLGIACNSMLDLDYDPKGLPEDFVVRGYLAQPRIEAGLDFLRRIPHASGQNYTVSGPDGQVLNLECSRGGVVAWRPWEGSDRVYHTNHALASMDDAIYHALMDPLTAEQRSWLCSVTSASRLAELERWFGDPQSAMTVERIKAAFSSPIGPLCRHGRYQGRTDNYTLGCLIMTFGESPRFEVSPGPPDVTPFQAFRF